MEVDNRYINLAFVASTGSISPVFMKTSYLVIKIKYRLGFSLFYQLLFELVFIGIKQLRGRWQLKTCFLKIRRMHIAKLSDGEEIITTGHSYTTRGSRGFEQKTPPPDYMVHMHYPVVQ